jgi:DNA-binding LytR/AlgR family response regulator
LWIGGRSHLLREPMRLLEARVRAHGFVRAHRRALVRLGGVRELAWTDAGTLVAVLGCGVRIPVSRRQRATFTAAVRSQVLP